MTESPQYTVVRKDKDFEIRQYSGYIRAQVTVDSSGYRQAAEAGFRVLAGYIFGNNVSKQKIAMTSPVTAAQSEQIAMTTPVTISAGERYTVGFIMPAAYTLETLPDPKDASIRFEQVPPHQAAAVRFTGYFNPAAIERGKLRLSQWLSGQGLETEGDFTVAGYNPPWVPGFLARNEVMVRLR